MWHRGEVVKAWMFLQGWVRRIHVIGISIAGSLLLATGAWAQIPLTVNTTDDGVDADLTDGKCEIAPPAPPGTCTLRAAVMQANRFGGDVAITVPAGFYVLSGGELNLGTPLSIIFNPVITITGAGPALTNVDGNGTSRLVTVESGRTANISNLTLRHGAATGYGGGVQNHGVLTLTNVVVRDNQILDGCGAGIFSDNQLGVYSSTITANSTVNNNDGGGGGICSYAPADLTIVSSTIDHNHARFGGGLYTNSVAVMVNSTVSGNYASFNGGGIFNVGLGPINVYNSTIAFNQADADSDMVGDGGGIYNQQAAGTFNIIDTIVATNYRSDQPATYDDCFGAIGIYGNNRYSPSFSNCTPAAGSFGTITRLDSRFELGPLRDNGGPTMTHALVPPSTMIDGAGACVDSSGDNPLTVDQRGSSRVMVGLGCDIGAFEFNNFIFHDGFELP